MAVEDQLADVGVLAEPVRRALYAYVLRQDEPVSREQASQAVGVPLHSVKLHLDRLTAAGLLDVEYRRLTGRTGPGAGRPAKLYRRTAREVALSVPPRRYDLVGDVLATAVERSVSDGVDVAEAVALTAREAGRALVDHEPGTDQPQPAEGTEDLVRLARALAAHGYEPRVEGAELQLANCPYHRLAAAHTALVCSLNLALVEGVLDALGASGLRPRLEPAPGACCVRVGT